MKRAALVVAMLLVVASPAFAQAPARSGFTVFANLGVGFQTAVTYDETGIGLAGLNFGAGWFLTDKVAVLGRYSGTYVALDALEGENQTSGVWAGSIQYWLNKWASIEGGVGYGRWSNKFDGDDDGVGLIIGFGATVFQRGRHHVRAGFEYAPVFTDDRVHNMGVTIGYQFVR